METMANCFFSFFLTEHHSNLQNSIKYYFSQNTEKRLKIIDFDSPQGSHDKIDFA